MPLGRLAAIATLAFLVVVITATSALASTFLRRDPGNVLLTSGSAIAGSTGSFVVTTAGFGTMSCSNVAFDATVGPSGGATASAALTSLSLADCTGFVGAATIRGCTARSPLPSITFTATGAGGPATWGPTSLRCFTLGGTAACYYGFGNGTGSYANGSATLSYVNQLFNRTVPAGTSDDLGGVCGSGSSSLSMDVRDIHTAGGSTVTVATS